MHMMNRIGIEHTFHAHTKSVIISLTAADSGPCHTQMAEATEPVRYTAESVSTAANKSGY